MVVDLLTGVVHDFGQFYRVSAIFGQVLFQEKKNEYLVLGIGFL